MQVGAWIADKQVKNVNSDLSFTVPHRRHKLTLGYYFAAFSSRDYWESRNNLLLQATNNGPILDLTLADGTKVTRQTTSLPAARLCAARIIRAPTMPASCRMSGRRHPRSAWMPSSPPVPRYRRFIPKHVDRRERHCHFLDTYTDQHADTHKVAATAGADYELTSELGLWTRYSRGNIFPQFDTVQSDWWSSNGHAYEGGCELHGNPSCASTAMCSTINFAVSRVSILPRTARLRPARCGQYLWYRAHRDRRILYGFSFGASGTYLHARYADFINGGVDSSGNQVQSSRYGRAG